MASVSTVELATELRLLVGRIARRLRQQSTGGLTPSQLSALASIERLAPVQLGDLARVEAIAPPTLTRAVARLEERRLVRRRPDPADGRAALVEVTAAGRRALTDVRNAQAAFLLARLGQLTEDERVVIAKAVRVLGRLLPQA